MKKIILIAVLLISFASANSQSTYTYIAQRYRWLAGLFEALGLPAGSGPAAFTAGQNQRAGQVYYDSSGIDQGVYVWTGLTWQLIAGGSQTLQQVFNTEVGGSVLTKNDTVLLSGFNLTIKGPGTTQYDFQPTQFNFLNQNAGSSTQITGTAGGGFDAIANFAGTNNGSNLNLSDGFARLNAQNTLGPESNVYVYPDSIALAPQGGALKFRGIVSGSGTAGLRYDPATNAVTYETGSGGSATLQDVIDNDSSFTYSGSGLGIDIKNTGVGAGMKVDNSSTGVGLWLTGAKALQIEDGNEGAGKVWTSDASGVGSWQNLSAGNLLYDSIGDDGISPVTVINDTLISKRISATGGISFYHSASGGLVIDGSGIAGGANQQLSNLSSVAVNTSLVSDANNTDDLGSTVNAWRRVHTYDLRLRGSTSGEMILQPAAVAGTGTLTFPATTSTVAVLGLAQTWTQNQTFSGGFISAQSGLFTNTTSTTSNFAVPSAAGANQITTSQLLFRGAASVYARVIGRGSTGGSIGANSSYGGWVIGDQGVSEATSGTHALLSAFVIKPSVITDAAGSTTDLATVYIEGPMTGVTPTGGTYSLLIGSGNARLENGNLTLNTAGNKLNIATGSNASIGTSVLVAGTVTVNTTAVTASSKIFLTVGVAGGTQGFLSVGTVTAGTSFVINSTSATETSQVNWIIIN